MPCAFSLCRGTLLILLLSAPLFVFSSCAPQAPPGKVTRASLGRVRLGMTEEEVRAALGAPPPEKIVSNAAPPPINLTYTIYSYETVDGPGAAVFFENGRVVAANYNNEQILSNVR